MVVKVETSEPELYMQSVVELMDKVRTEFGWNLEIMHDVHERLSLADTLSFAREMEAFKLFFLEDCVRPDQGECLRYLRHHSCCQTDSFCRCISGAYRMAWSQ